MRFVPCRIRVGEWVIVHVGVAVEGLRTQGIRHDSVSRGEPGELSVIVASTHVSKPCLLVGPVSPELDVVGELRGSVNRRVAYVSRHDGKAVESL
jgi:hypothetical protein